MVVLFQLNYFLGWFKISKEELIKQINICKNQIADLEGKLINIDEEIKKFKNVKDDTLNHIKNIKKEIDGLKEDLLKLEKEDILAEKHFLRV